MSIHRQYQPPHQMHPIIAKFDRLLDKMESRMDAADRRVENLRRKQYASPHQSGRSQNTLDGYFSRHPRDAANHCIGDPRAPPLPEPPPHPTPAPPYAQRTRRSYLTHSQSPPVRSYSSGYTARQNAHRPPPPHRASQGYSDYDQPPPCAPSCWDTRRRRTDHCCTPQFIGPDSFVQRRHSYAQYHSWQPQYQPRSATKVEDPINATVDHLLEAFDGMDTRVDATDHRMSEFRSSPQPEPNLVQPNVSPLIRKIAYPPSTNIMDSFGPSGLSPNDSSSLPRHRTKSDQPPARQPSCEEPPLTATLAVDQLLQLCQPLPSLPRSVRQLQQLSPAPPLELLPYSPPEPSLPLHPQPVTDPLLASYCHPQAAVSSSGKKEWKPNLRNSNEYGLINDVVPCLHDVVLKESIVEDKWKENEMESKGLVGSSYGEDSDIFSRIKTIILRDPGICVRFSKRKCEILAMQMAKMNLRDSKRELPHEGVIRCLFATEPFRIELHMCAKHVFFPIARKFNGTDEGDEGRRLTLRCVFDPGGDASPRLLLSTLVVASWFPP